MTGTASNRYSDAKISAKTVGEVCTICTKQTTNDKLADTHAQGTVNEDWSSTGVVNEEEDYRSEDDEQSILDAGCDEVDVSCKTGHLEDVNNVIGHYVCSRELLPGLHRRTGEGTSPHAILEELAPSLLALAFCSHDECNFFPLRNHQRVLLITTTLNLGKDFDSLIKTTDLGQPTGRSR